MPTSDGRAIRYKVGVGRKGKTWAGESFIDGKYVRPSWAPPEEIRREKPELPSVIPAGSPSNPMGAAAMTLSGGEYAIHGTNAPGSIGGFVSYGCIRMYNEDIVDLFDRVQVGTRVIVTRDSATAINDTDPPASAAGRTVPCDRLEASVWKMRSGVALESNRNTGEIGEPQPRLVAADFAFRRFAVRQQAVVPQPAGTRVMFAPGFDVMHLETVAFEIGRGHADMVEFAARENVTRNRNRFRPFLAEPLVVRAWPRA